MSQELVKYQSWSVATRIATTSIGIIQGIVIVRLLSPADYGLIGIVLAIGGLIGVAQHFGLATGSIREISITKTLKEASKVLFSSLFVRLLISFPLAITLFFVSGYIANNIYHHPEIAFPLKLFSLVIIIQGGQDIFAATLSGLQRFKQLFSFQFASSVIGLTLFAVLVKHKGFMGYFFAMLAIAPILFLILVIVNFRIFGKKFILPDFKEFRQIFKNVFKIGFTMYILKILYIIWQKTGILIAGLFLLPKEIGYINFALFLGMKTTFFTDAVSGVNLPVMTKKYSENFEIYKREFKENFSKIFSLAFLGSIIVIFYSKEIMTLLLGTKYTPAFFLIPFFVFSYLLYSLINLIGASVILPSLMLKESIYCQVILSVSSILAISLLLIFGAATTAAVGIGMLIAVSLALSYQLCAIYGTLGFNIFDTRFLVLILSLTPMLGTYVFVSNWIVKIVTFLVSLVLYSLLLKKFKILNLENLLFKIARRVKSYQKRERFR